jgi:hypothetical protein
MSHRIQSELRLIGYANGYAVFTIMLGVVILPALADTYLHCPSIKVVMTSGLHGETSSEKKEDLMFRLDDAAKTIKFTNNTPLTITRFDRSWISAESDSVSYEFDRQDGTLSFASSTMKDGVATTIVGSGRCQIAAAPRR